MALNKQNVVAWHNRSTPEHKELVDKWAAKGFRTLSLSLYGTPGDPRFAAVMVKRPVVIATKQFGPLNQAGIQAKFDEMVSDGWGPFILTATGPRNSAVFAGVFTPMKLIPKTRLNLSATQFAEECGKQQAVGSILWWVDAFGSANDPRYTAIWGANPSRQAWNCDAIDEGGADLQARFEALKDTWCRPALISVTPAGRCAELFVDSAIGPWSSRVGMTSAQYQAEYDKHTKAGLQPIHVSASGSGAGARFAAIFASREEADERVFRAKGPVTVGEIDSAMDAYMRDSNLRGTALAIVQGTRLIYAKGYTFAEPAPTYPDVLPRHCFVKRAFQRRSRWSRRSAPNRRRQRKKRNG